MDYRCKTSKGIKLESSCGRTSTTEAYTVPNSKTADGLSKHHSMARNSEDAGLVTWDIAGDPL